jgi:hypothetical protein
MRKFIFALMIIAAVFTFAVSAKAQHAPVQYTHEHAMNAVYSEWTVPYAQQGALLSLQMLGITNAATVAVQHIATYASGKAVTNAVEATAANSTLYVYPSAYIAPVTTYYVTNDVILTATSTPVKPVWLGAGDRISFVLSATNSAMTAVIKTSKGD